MARQNITTTHPLTWEKVQGEFDKVNDNFTELYASGSLSAVSQSIIPNADVTYDLGSPTHRFRDLYLSGSTIDLGGVTIGNNNGTLTTSAPFASTALQSIIPSKGTGGKAVAFVKKSEWSGTSIQETNWGKAAFVDTPIAVSFVARTYNRVLDTAAVNSTTITLGHGAGLATPPLKTEWYTWFKGEWDSATTYNRGNVVIFGTTQFPIPTAPNQVGLFAVAKRTVLNVDPSTVDITTSSSGPYQVGGGESEDWIVISYINDDPTLLSWKAPWQANQYDVPWWHPEYQDGGANIESGMLVVFPYPNTSKDSYLIDGYTQPPDPLTVVSVNGNQIVLSAAVSIPAGFPVKFQKELSAIGGNIVGNDTLIDGIVNVLGGGSAPSPAVGTVPLTPPDASVPTPNTMPYSNLTGGITVQPGLQVRVQFGSALPVALGKVSSTTSVSGSGYSYSAVIIDTSDPEFSQSPNSVYAWADFQGATISFSDPGFDNNIYALIPEPAEAYEYGLVTVPGNNYDSNDLPMADVELLSNLDNIDDQLLPPQTQPSIIVNIENNMLRSVEFFGGELLGLGGNNGYINSRRLLVEERPETTAGIPSSISDLENDAGYITLETLPYIPSDISDLTDTNGLLEASTILTTVAKTGGDQLTPTAIDLTKSVNKLSSTISGGRYTLADGVEGQLVYLTQQDATAGIFIDVANVRINGVLDTDSELTFSAIYGNIITLLFVDGAWQQGGGEWAV